MDYEKKYKEAFELMKDCIPDEDGLVHVRPCDIFPELAESEGERMIKKIIATIHLYYGEPLEDEAKEMLAYLEKQGEQKPAMIQWKGDNLKEVVDFTGKCENFDKWFKSFEEYEKYVHEHNDIFKIFNEDGSHIEVPVGAWIIKAPDGYNTASRFAISPILTELSIESNFKFKKAIEAIENYVNSFPHSQRPEIWQHINFLKSLKDRVQPKQEWSEEDERLREYCINAINGIHYYSPENKQELVGWLKSLRPQNWTKEDKDRYISCLQRLSTGNPEQPETINSKWFKEHVYPQKQWKPSLAQLNALSIVSKGNAPDDIEEINSLYNDLKKLREE